MYELFIYLLFMINATPIYKVYAIKFVIFLTLLIG